MVNFGGPRSLTEVQPFLRELLCDQDVLRTPLPAFLHRLFFRKIADRRTKKISHDYTLIGGKSPIYEDTEAVAQAVSQKLGSEVLTFHRYLPATHKASLEQIASKKNTIVFPLFPQFTYATTGSIARFFKRHLPSSALARMKWISSYHNHPAYIRCMQKTIADFLAEKQLKQEEVLLLFSAHGLPQKFITTGDPYQDQCRDSYDQIRKAFPKAAALLSFQSKFGPGEWLRPYTVDVCKTVSERQHIIFVPLSFTSDHIETLFEVEYQYLPLIRERGLKADRCPALGRRSDWIEAIAEIFQMQSLVKTDELIFSTALL
ncbi:MAG: ferrochelatase [Verrucomicrobia bacterium]|nr:ferrochelatase [Verrucomicrobiota bacterium]